MSDPFPASFPGRPKATSRVFYGCIESPNLENRFGSTSITFSASCLLENPIGLLEQLHVQVVIECCKAHLR
ncbi:MAG: hypothetical protein ABIJ04_02765 [Bacteroidota bacterium]